jgi:hypothetical protein
MPLILADLENGFINAFKAVMNSKESILYDEKNPELHPTLVASMADAYINYIGKIIAGALKPTTATIDKSVLIKDFKQIKFAGIGAGITKLWTKITWEGPGFIPANPTISTALKAIEPAVITLMQANQKLASAGTVIKQEDFAKALAGIVDASTRLLTVNATTTTAPPVVSILMIS